MRREELLAVCDKGEVRRSVTFEERRKVTSNEVTEIKEERNLPKNTVLNILLALSSTCMFYYYITVFEIVELTFFILHTI